MTKFGKLAVVIVSLTMLGFALIAQPTGQSQEQSNAPINKSTGGMTNRGIDAARSGTPQASPTPDFSKATWNIPEDADKTKNPIEATEDSVAKGKELYLARKGNCIFCHGETGAGNEENLPQLRRKPADLSNKERMSKISDGEVFWKISLGIPGIMPGRDKTLTEEERWHVVNYVRTLAKEK